jgi:hypothetical protein
MRRLAMTLCAAFVAAGATAAAAKPGRAATLCVGNGSVCYATLKAAVDAAHDGDTIKVGPGTFAGGMTIDVSIRIVGSGAHATVIRGGGPVLTIGRQLDPDPPTVSIRGLTITGGDVSARGDDAFAALGGGVLIEIGSDFGRGGTVTITDSIITGNRAAPRETNTDGDFALAQGGGIDNFGDLTLVNTEVTNNESGSARGRPSLATQANAGGIYNHVQAALRLEGSLVRGNRARVTSPHDGAADSGGIFTLGETTITNSVVSENTAELVSSAPVSVDQASLAGGIHVAFCPVEFCGPPHPTTITNSIVRGNRATAQDVDVAGLAVGFAGGIEAEGPLLLERSVVTDNVLRAVSAGDAAADGGGLEVLGQAKIRDSLIGHNSVLVEAVRAALAQGGGIANAGQLTLERTIVLGNSVHATGSGGDLPFGLASAAQGGGIWNASFSDDAPPQLTMTDSAVLRNSVSASHGFLVQGGGLYTDFPVSLRRTLVAGNQPDQCFGC